MGTAFIFAMPVAAGIGAFLGATTARNGMDAMRRVAGRSQLQTQARAILEPAAWTGVGYAVGSAPALVATALVADYSTLRLGPIIAQVCCVAAVTAVGQVAGASLPWYLGTPVCAVVVYFMLGVLSFEADSILISLTPIDERRTTFEPLMTWVLLVQATFWLAIFAHVLLRRSELRRSAATALVAAGLAAAPLLYVTPATRGVDPSAAKQECSSVAPIVTSRPQSGDSAEAGPLLTLCLPRAKEVVRDQMEPEFNTAAQLLAGLMPRHATILDDEAAGISEEIDREISSTEASERARGATVVRLSRAGDISSYSRVDTNQIHYQLVAYLIPPAVGAGDEMRVSAESKDLRSPATPTDVLWRWYLTEVGARIDGEGEFGGPLLDDRFLNYEGHQQSLRFLAGLSVPQRTAWFEKHAESIRLGTLAWTDFRLDA